MLEVSQSHLKPVNLDTLIQECMQGCINTTLMESKDQVVSIYHETFYHGYPTPHLDRDGHLDVLLPKLANLSILSRGRFGAYKYEVANQDHSFMQGIEAAEFLVSGEPEKTVFEPNVVNAKFNSEFPYPKSK